MCGIAGATRNLLGDNPERLLGRMNEAMLHRGPDMGGITIDDHLGLCHRRLSIIDLSEEGKQPMFTPDGRYTIVFNGEIYNFLELRKELQALGYKFHISFIIKPLEFGIVFYAAIPLIWDSWRFLILI